MRKRYIIWSPGYSRSSGVRNLYALYDALRNRGYETLIFPWTHYFSLYRTPPQYRHVEKRSDVSAENDIVIYPEVVRGNPLRFRNVVRYILYHPGYWGGTTTFHPSEKIFTWWKEYYDAPTLMFPHLDTKTFFDAGLPKTQDCCFIHKRGKWKEVKETEGLTVITRDIPKHRPDLVKLLQTTRILYSYDKESVLNLEAVLCGAQVKIITEDGFEDLTAAPQVDVATFRRELEYFIRETQQMDYQGEIEQTPMSRGDIVREIGKKITLPVYKYAARGQRGRPGEAGRDADVV